MNTVYHSQQFNVYWTHFEYTFTSLQQDGTYYHRGSARTSYFLINVQMYELNEPEWRWHASLPCTCSWMRMAAQSYCNHFDRYLVGVIIVLSKFSFSPKTICWLMAMSHLEIKIWRFVNTMLFCDTFYVLKCKKKKWISVIFCSIVKPNT